MPVENFGAAVGVDTFETRKKPMFTKVPVALLITVWVARRATVHEAATFERADDIARLRAAADAAIAYVGVQVVAITAMDDIGGGNIPFDDNFLKDLTDTFKRK